MFRFNYVTVSRPSDAYYRTDWSRAVPVGVVADTEPEAWRTVVALMGDAGRDRYWTGRLVSVEPACCPPNTTHTKGTES